MPRFASLPVLAALGALLGSGCRDRHPGAQTAVDRFEQLLVLEIEGTVRRVPLDAMDVWLSRNPSRPEPFEIHGNGVALVGTLPRELRIGYEENWRALVGHKVVLAARGGDPRYEKPAVLGVPGVGQFRVMGGSFTVEKVDPGWNGQTPLTGRIELRVRTARGESVLNDTLTVKAMTWG